MKVGLLTFHSAHNYGAVLQAYATQEIVKNLGYELNCIDYSPSYLFKQKTFPSIKNKALLVKFKLIIESLIVFYWKIKRRKAFNNFIHSKLNVSKEKYGQTPFSKNDTYDVFIMGSDQIWNIMLTKGFDDVYWGNFKTKQNAIKISYAASMSNYSLNEKDKKEMSLLLNNFTAIGVREEETKEFIYNNFKKNVEVTLDPVFLLDRAQWKLISKKPKIKKKYVLVYSLGFGNDLSRIAKSIANQLNATIIELTMIVDKNAVVNKFQTAPPEEFLGLFENAEFVLTSSYHGTAFSIVFNKPFYSLAHGNEKDSRQITLLRNLGLLERFIDPKTKPELQLIDYTNPNKKLDLMRKNSFNFLKNSLVVR